MSETCDACTALGLTPSPDHAAAVAHYKSRLTMLRDIPAEVQSTHWTDDAEQGTRGCWSHHRACAIARVEQLTAAADALADELTHYQDDNSAYARGRARAESLYGDALRLAREDRDAAVARATALSAMGERLVDAWNAVHHGNGWPAVVDAVWAVRAALAAAGPIAAPETGCPQTGNAGLHCGHDHADERCCYCGYAAGAAPDAEGR